MFLKKKRNNLKDRRTALCTLRTCLFLSSIILVWGSTYPTHLRRLVLLQNCIVIVISKKGFEAHTDPLFKNLMILKLEDIYLFFASREISNILQFLPAFPDPFYVLIKFMVITRVVQIDFIFISFLPYQHEKVFCFLLRCCLL